MRQDPSPRQMLCFSWAAPWFSSSSLSHRESMLKSWIMFHFWLLTNLIPVTASIKKEFQLLAAWESIGGAWHFYLGSCTALIRLFMCMFRNQIRSERLEFGVLEHRFFYLCAIVHEMWWNRTSLTFDLWIKGYRKASKMNVLSYQVLFLNTMINTRCLLS